VSDDAAPKITIIEQMIMPSDIEEVSRSRVTFPPIRIPGIQCGRGRIGIRNRTVPGIGTPIRTPMIARRAIIHSDNFNVHVKLFDQGAFSFWVKTRTEITPTTAIAYIGEFTRAIDIAIAHEKIHHVSG